MNWSVLLTPLLQNLSSIVIGAAALLINHSIKKPTDQDKADHLSQIANEAAALVTLQSKGAPWAVLLQNTITQITNAAGLPVKNEDAIKRAAAAALKAHGVTAA